MSEDGECFVWGWNDDGQLGVGDIQNRNKPTLNQLVNNNRNRNTTTKIVTKVQCDGNHSVIQMNDGRWFVFGANYNGQLGIGNREQQETPIELPSPIVDNENDSKDNRFINIFCGYSHNIGITENGDCYGWGSNMSGQLGLGNYTNCTTPTKLKEAPLSTLNQVQQKQRYIWFSCGFNHTVALTNLGIVCFISTTVNTIQFMM